MADHGKFVKATRKALTEVIEYFGDVSLEWLMSLPETKEQALETGNKYYYNKHCMHGHIAPRNAVSGTCSVCARKDNKDRYKENPDKVNKSNMAYQKKAYKERPEFKAANLMRSQLKRALKVSKLEKTTDSESILGYSSQEFKLNIESKFKDGMSWSNHGSMWELDHILPVCSFDLSSMDEVKMCNSLDNLQPLWIFEHKLKTQEDINTYLFSPKLDLQKIV